MKLDRGYSKLYTPLVFKVPPGGTNWIGVGLHNKLPLGIEPQVQDQQVADPADHQQYTVYPEGHALPEPNMLLL